MTKIDIFSGFLGAGKTTLIKKLIEEAYKDEKVVLIENEFGEIGIDGGFLKDAGVEINEMNSGCICCSLVGDFGRALEKVMAEFKPDRIIIEPSGVGKLSDVIKAVQDVANSEMKLNAFTTVVDAKKTKMYMKNFGEFFNNQVENANAIILSHTAGLNQGKIDECLSLLREHNNKAAVVSTPWEEINGIQILATMENRDSMADELAHLEGEAHEHHHHNHNHEHGDGCCCGGHGHGHEHNEEHEHEHHHHDHDHEHGDGCCCGGHGHVHDEEHEHEHHHHHHHDHEHHHADDVFTSIGIETAHKFKSDNIQSILEKISDSDEYGMVLRVKGIVPSEEGQWIHFDYVPGEPDVRRGSSDVIGKICIIGAGIDEAKLKALFEI